jgi:hypothetical protein
VAPLVTHGLRDLMMFYEDEVDWLQEHHGFYFDWLLKEYTTGQCTLDEMELSLTRAAFGCVGSARVVDPLLRRSQRLALAALFA